MNKSNQFVSNNNLIDKQLMNETLFFNEDKDIIQNGFEALEAYQEILCKQEEISEVDRKLINLLDRDIKELF